jgi:hypothetical protein
MKAWIGALSIAAVLLTGGCRGGAAPPPPLASPSDRGRWQVVPFTPSEDTDVDGAILLDTQTGESFVLCEYATAWCKLDRDQ